MVKKEGIYSEKGDYHKNINKKWAYYPIFLSKMKFIDKFFESIPKSSKIVDAGCGEGFLVEKFRKKGYNIKGLDINYSSKYVQKGDISKIPFKNKSFDAVLCLEALQYLSTEKQKKAIFEMKRVLKDNGTLVITVPNLKHFAAYLYRLIKGKWKPTDSKTLPIGDKSANEYVKMFKEQRFKIIKRKGWLPTNFVICSLLISKFPDKLIWLYNILNKLAIPGLSYTNLLICKKK